MLTVHSLAAGTTLQLFARIGRKRTGGEMAEEATDIFGQRGLRYFKVGSAAGTSPLLEVERTLNRTGAAAWFKSSAGNGG